MTSEITLFVNPTAGRGRGARAARPAASAFRDAGFRKVTQRIDPWGIFTVSLAERVAP